MHLNKMRILFFIITVCIFEIGLSQYKQPEEVKFDAFLTEIQYSSDNPDAIEMVFWLPTKFWEISVAQDASLTYDDFVAIKELLENYELFAVVDGEIGYFGGVTYKTAEETLKGLSIFYQGEKLKIVDPKELSSDLIAFTSMMKPMMANMMGPMGENMHFIFMSRSSGNIDPYAEDNFLLELDDFKREVDLPLESLLEEKECPKDGKLHSGKWTYCPFHGVKLISK